MDIMASVSGLMASQTRLANSANNVANISTTTTVIDGKKVAQPYRPTDVVQFSVEPDSGVRTKIEQRNPAETLVYAPNDQNANEDGMLALPNVGLEQETADQILATHSFMGNVRALQAEMDMQDSVLDIAA